MKNRQWFQQKKIVINYYTCLKMNTRFFDGQESVTEFEIHKMKAG